MAAASMPSAAAAPISAPIGWIEASAGAEEAEHLARRLKRLKAQKQDARPTTRMRRDQRITTQRMVAEAEIGGLKSVSEVHKVSMYRSRCSEIDLRERNNWLDDEIEDITAKLDPAQAIKDMVLG